MKRILVVDDDHAILEAMQLALEDGGYTVQTVVDSNSAASEAERFHPHVILLDLLLSGKDGTQVIQLLKENTVTKHIPVILLSAHPSAAQTAKSCGATDFLAKPFDVDELLDKVKKYTRG